jgi:hypothetical protein
MKSKLHLPVTCSARFTATQIEVLRQIVLECAAHGVCYPGAGKLAERVGVRRETAARAIAEAVRFGLIAQDQRGPYRIIRNRALALTAPD